MFKFERLDVLPTHAEIYLNLKGWMCYPCRNIHKFKGLDELPLPESVNIPEFKG